MGASTTGRILYDGELKLEQPAPVLMVSVGDVGTTARLNQRLEEELAVYRALVAHFVEQLPEGRVEIAKRDLAPAWSGPDPLVERTPTGFVLHMPESFDLEAHRANIGEYFREVDSPIIGGGALELGG